jgi:ABC-type bacteriocin/lantibiotic exporter with double-glycine peptidase domain
MRFIDYLKDKIISVFICVCLIVVTTVLLIVFSVNIFLIVYIPLFITVSLMFIFSYDFLKKRNWYNNILSNLEKLDKKFLIQEIITKSDFLEGKLFYEIIQEVNRSMIENINEYKFRQEDFREYIEMWVHEI